MGYFIIGEQIQKFRKKAGLTQKELGEAIGISSSAVSQWETGGTPDISLLPAIADRLGVTVDSLFGREKVTQENMREALPRYVASLPESKRIEEICCLMWEAMKTGCMGPYTPDDSRSHDYHIYFASEEGVMLGASAEEMSFMSVFPEPKKGYDAFFATDEMYVKLFSTLAEPHAFQLLKLLYQRPPKYCTTGVMASRMGISLEETEALLSEFAELQLVQKLELDMEDGGTDAYIANDFGALVPFLYTAHLMVEKFGSFHLVCNKRKQPLLKNLGGTGKGGESC